MSKLPSDWHTNEKFLQYLSAKLGFNFLKHSPPKLHGLSVWDSQHGVYAKIPGDFLELIYLQWRQIGVLKLRAKSVPKPDKRGTRGK